MTLTVDLQNQGQVDYCMAFFIFGCIYDIDWIYVSISLYSMPRFSQLLKFVTRPQRMTLEIKVRVTHCDPLFIMGCIRDRDTMLGVDLNISDVLNLNMTNICRLTSIVDLENQGQTYFRMTSIISG